MASVFIDYLLSRRKISVLLEDLQTNLLPGGGDRRYQENDEHHRHEAKQPQYDDNNHTNANVHDDNVDSVASSSSGDNNNIFLQLPYLNNKKEQGTTNTSNEKITTNTSNNKTNDTMMYMAPKASNNLFLETSASTLSTIDLMDSLTSIDYTVVDDNEDKTTSPKAQQNDKVKHVPQPVQQQQQQQRPQKRVRFALAVNGGHNIKVKTIIHRYPAATCPVTHGRGINMDDFALAETRIQLCSLLYWSENEMNRLRNQNKKRAVMYSTLARMYVPCVDRLFDGNGFANASPPTASTKNRQQNFFTEKEAIQFITSASIRGLEYPCSTKMQRHRQWAKDQILEACQEEYRCRDEELAAAQAAATQNLANVCIRVSGRPKAFARKLAQGDARVALEICMSKDDVTTSRRELQLLTSKNNHKRQRRRSATGSCVKTKKNQPGKQTTTTSSSLTRRKSHKENGSSSNPRPQQQQQRQQRKCPPTRDKGCF